MKSNLNTSLMKLTIKLLILLILLVILFIISTILYSSIYWPDVYNYINANITIKRIPTITELNLTVFKVDEEYATEVYSTTDNDNTDTTDFDTNTEDYLFAFEDFDLPANKMKRSVKIEDINNDYSEVPKKGVLVDYFFVDEDANTKLIKDLIDESKLTAKDSKDVEILSRQQEIRESTAGQCHGTISEAVYPWIATVFVKNDTKQNQFEYYCDGALVSSRLVLTAARCVNILNETVDAANLLIVLGKRSLHSVAESEKVRKVTEILTHENFTVEDGIAKNDLAMLVLDEEVSLNEAISTACIAQDTPNVTEFATTAWGFTGELTPIYFDKETSESCNLAIKSGNSLCATYGNDVALCPSYGGLLVARHADTWYLHGVRTGDPSVRGVCLNRQVTYSDVLVYNEWIAFNIDSN